MKKEIEHKTDKVYCRYTIIDLHTGYGLVYGEKWKDYHLLHLFNEYDGYFHTGWKRRRIDKYHREINIKGRECLIVYWAGAPVRKTGSVVSPAGCLAGLSGKTHDNGGMPLRFCALLRSMGYRRRKVKVK